MPVRGDGVLRTSPSLDALVRGQARPLAGRLESRLPQPDQSIRTPSQMIHPVAMYFSFDLLTMPRCMCVK